MNTPINDLWTKVKSTQSHIFVIGGSLGYGKTTLVCGSTQADKTEQLLSSNQ